MINDETKVIDFIKKYLKKSNKFEEDNIFTTFGDGIIEIDKDKKTKNIYIVCDHNSFRNNPYLYLNKVYLYEEKKRVNAFLVYELSNGYLNLLSLSETKLLNGIVQRNFMNLKNQ